VEYRHQQELEMMQMKQQQELQRYLQQVQENIETVSAAELLQAIISQQPFLSEQSVASGVSTATAWSSVVQLAPPPTGVIYSTAGVHQSPLPATFVPHTLGDVNQQQMSSAATLPPETMVDSLHSETNAGLSLPAATLFGPSVVDGLTASDSWPVPAVNADIPTIPDALDLATEVADTADRSCSPGVSLRRSSSLKEQVRPAASSDCEATTSDQSVHASLRRKQSAEAAALLIGDVLNTVPSPVDNVPLQLPEVSSLGFVPIQNQLISSRSDSMDSMASSVAGSSQQQPADNSDLVHHSQPVSAREMTVAESGSAQSASHQPTSVQPMTTAGSQNAAELLETLQSLLGQFSAANSDAVRPSHSSPLSTVEPAQQLQQSQVIIQQQQQQQLAAIVSAIQNLQHLRSLQEAIGSLAVALKTSQLQMLSAALQAGEVTTSAVPSSVSSVAGSAMTVPATARPPTVPVSSAQAATAAVPPAVPVSSTAPGLVPDPRSFPASQLTAAQLAALGLQQYPAAANALLMPSAAVQQQQQQLMLAMMQSAPYQQQQQQLLVQQLLSQNAMMMQQGAVRAGGRVAPQPWPMMMPVPPQSAVRRATPAMVSAQQLPQRLAVPNVASPVTSTLPPPAGTPVPLRSGAQTPVAVRPAMTSSSSNVSVPSVQTSLPDQR